MKLLLRVAMLLGVVSLLTWLAKEPSVIEQRWTRIQAELDRGHIGQLPEEVRQSFEDNIRWLTSYAGVSDDLVINRPRKKGALHVYSTTSLASGATGCIAGNAVYDADLDAVFIDEQIVNPTEIPLLGESGRTSLLEVKDLAFVAVYFRFVLLHELGHRRLHRHLRGFYDKTRGPRDLKVEADDFAIRTLVAAYSSDVATGKRDLGESAAEFIAMDRLPKTPAERVWIDLVGAAYATSLVQMFSASDFSSFYSDSAHPNFVQRASRIFDSAVKAKEVDDTLKSHARVFQEGLNRLQEFAQSKFIEIHIPEGVQQVAIGADHLAVLTQTGQIYTAALAQVDKKRTLDIASLPGSGPYGSPNDAAWLTSIWESRTEGLNIFRPAYFSPLSGNQSARVLSFRNNLFRDRADISAKLPTNLSGKLLTAPQPADFAIVANDQQITVIGRGFVNEISLQELQQKIASGLGKSELYLELCAPGGDAVHVALFESNQKHYLYGIAEIRLDGSLRSITHVNFRHEEGGDAIGLADDRVVAIPCAKGYEYVYCTRNRTNFLLFELSESKPMKLVARYPFIFDKALKIGGSTYGVAAFDPHLRSAWWLPPDQVVAQFIQDSVFCVDRKSAHCSQLFPGLMETESCSGTNGHVVFYIKNGRKLYLVKAGR
jgi:hypothetical protein